MTDAPAEAPSRRAVPKPRWGSRAKERARDLLRAFRGTGPPRWPLFERSEPTRVVPAARAVLALAIAVYIGYWMYRTLRHHYGFGTFGFDLGIFDQGMWLMSRFEDPFVTVRGLNLFGDHTSFILILLVPLYWAWPSAEVLLIAQTLALGLAAVPAFLLARERLRSEWLAAGVGIGLLVSPLVSWTNYEQFHPDAFEIPLLLTAFYLMMKRRWGPFMACVVLLLLVKEDVPLAVFALGIFVALRYDRKVGRRVMLISAVWLLACLFVILPTFNEVGTVYGERTILAEFGGLDGTIKTLVTDPTAISSYLWSNGRPYYVLQLVAIFGGLWLLAPSLAAIALLPLLNNLTTSFGYQYKIEYHYQTLIAPVLLAASVVGISRFSGARVRTALTTLLVAASLFGAYMWGPYGRPTPPMNDPNDRFSQIAREALDLIPDDAAVSAQWQFVPHLTHRELIFDFANPFLALNWGDYSIDGQPVDEYTDDIEYIITGTILDERWNEVLNGLSAQGWTTIFDREGIKVYVAPDA